MSQAAEFIAERAYNFLTRSFRVLRTANAQSALTLERLSALQAVDRLGPLSVADLAKLEGVHASTMSRMVSSLVGRGLVRRVPDQNDGRGTLVTSTGRGRAEIKRALRANLKDLVGTLSRFTAHERAEVEDALSVVEKLIVPPDRDSG